MTEEHVTMSSLAKECLRLFHVEYDELPREVYDVTGKKIDATTFIYIIQGAPFGSQTISMKVRVDVVEDGFLIFRTTPFLPEGWDSHAFLAAIKSNIAAPSIGSFCYTPESEEISFTHGIFFPQKSMMESFASCAEIAVMNMVMSIDAWHSIDIVISMFSHTQPINAPSTLH